MSALTTAGIGFEHVLDPASQAFVGEQIKKLSQRYRAIIRPSDQDPVDEDPEVICTVYGSNEGLVFSLRAADEGGNLGIAFIFHGYNGRHPRKAEDVSLPRIMVACNSCLFSSNRNIDYPTWQLVFSICSEELSRLAPP